jgi:hypothetical protein
MLVQQLAIGTSALTIVTKLFVGTNITWLMATAAFTVAFQQTRKSSQHY